MAQKKNARTTRVRRSERKNIAVGQAHIKSTFNNTIVSISDPQGNVISWQSVVPSASRALVSPLLLLHSLQQRQQQRQQWSTVSTR